MTKRKNNRIIAVGSLFFLALSSSSLIGCGREAGIDTTTALTADKTAGMNESKNSGEKTSDETREAGEATGTGDATKAGGSAGTPEVAVTREEGLRLCRNITEAVEMQFPGQTFTEVSGDDSDISPLMFGGSYLFSERLSSEGVHYAVGVKLTGDNPLEGVSCGNGPTVAGFQFNQFDSGRMILLEKRNDATSDLSYLYDALQRGAEGVAYIADAGKRGVALIPPRKGSFLKVSMVKAGYSVTEFIPLTKEQDEELREGETSTDETGSGLRIALCKSREELPSIWIQAQQAPTVKMVEMAALKCGFDTLELNDIKDITKAVLSVEAHGEKREETLQNREELEHLAKLLADGAYGETRYDRSYSGNLLLTKADGSTMTIQLAFENGGYMLGNSVSCDLSEEDTSEIWSMFTMIDGWLYYGNRIHMEMKDSYYTADSPKLNFSLSSEMDEEIHYSLSPVVYKQELTDTGEKKWQRLNTIAGVCGTFTPMKESMISLSVPWKDAYELKGPGIYKLEIQVMPAQDVRFEISDVFELR